MWDLERAWDSGWGGRVEEGGEVTEKAQTGGQKEQALSLSVASIDENNIQYFIFLEPEERILGGFTRRRCQMLDKIVIPILVWALQNH